MPTTAKGLRYPSSSAAPNIPQDIQNLASDVNGALPGGWVRAFDSDTAYLFSPTANNAWEPLPGLTGISAGVIPTGRTLEIEFNAPTAQSSGGFMHVRLLINGGELDRNIFSECWGPVRLSGRWISNGTAATLRVEALRTAGVGDVRASGAALHLGYRIFA